MAKLSTTNRRSDMMKSRNLFPRIKWPNYRFQDDQLRKTRSEAGSIDSFKLVYYYDTRVNIAIVVQLDRIVPSQLVPF